MSPASGAGGAGPVQFLTPLALAGGLLALPILLLYMLRLRREELEVPSIMLWQQLLQDTEANTPWQRLRRNLLLLLQLLILAALVLALARPFIIVPAPGSGQIVLLLDASASMNAADAPEGSRFRAAQNEARSVVSAMGGDDRVTLIRVAEQPQLLAATSEDRLALMAAIDAAQTRQRQRGLAGGPDPGAGRHGAGRRAQPGHHQRRRPGRPGAAAGTAAERDLAAGRQRRATTWRSPRWPRGDGRRNRRNSSRA